MQIVDPHVHFWDLGRLRYPWLDKPGTNFLGDYRSLGKTHLPTDFVAEAGDVEVLKVVHVEAVAADTHAETVWLSSLADDPENRGFPNAIVANVDLAAPDAAAEIAWHAARPRVHGIRQILNVHPTPLYNYVTRHYMQDAAWKANFRLLRQHGLSFDLQVYPSQMAEAANLARDNPDTLIIVNHTGMFVDRDHPNGYVAWRDGMRLLADCPNVSAKISGLGMFDHGWTVESLRPYALETIATFGVDRVMFASNFPVDRLFSTYPALWRAYEAIVGGTTDDEKAALFAVNAERIYRLTTSTGVTS